MVQPYRLGIDNKLCTSGSPGNGGFKCLRSRTPDVEGGPECYSLLQTSAPETFNGLGGHHALRNPLDVKGTAYGKRSIAQLTNFVRKRTEVNAGNETRTLRRVRGRLQLEGVGFLTKTLPRLGKAFDRALSSEDPFDATKCGFRSIPGTRLPLFLGEFFVRVFNVNGVVLQTPCVKCVRVIRQVCYLFYKYELPYTDEQEQQVISRFESTEGDLTDLAGDIESLDKLSRTSYHCCRKVPQKGPSWKIEIVHNAQYLLNKLFYAFDTRDIFPRHGPGAVATRQRLQEKYLWRNISHTISSYYPIEEYFMSSLGEVADRMHIRKDGGSDYYYCDGTTCYNTAKPYDCMACRVVSSVTNTWSSESLPARVVLVPKDSRGPRLISCEPVDFQWVQQGLSAAIVKHVETVGLTKFNVFFTDQTPNQRGALLGSYNGKYATLDLNEASDRVSLSLVRLLFPKRIVDALEACRSSSTVLPSGKEISLLKFAPMGSALCFPILGLTVWSLLTAGAPDTDTRESILVYGDDVIVPSSFSEDAMSILESFGLRINRDKSCTKGLFRESCGMDAFAGECVTPVRLKTVWTSSRRSDVYASYLDYSNNFYMRGYRTVAEKIGEMLFDTYGAGTICGKPPREDLPHLLVTPANVRAYRTRWNTDLQKVEYLLWTPKAKVAYKARTGWHSLLRYFVEARDQPPEPGHVTVRTLVKDNPCEWVEDFERAYAREAFSVRLYTERRGGKPSRCWRG